MSVTVVVTGLEKINRMLDPAGFHRAADRALDLSAQVWRDDVKKLPPVSVARTGYEAKGIPVDTGTMRQRVAALRLGPNAAGVQAKTNYAGFVHDGTGKMPARPFFWWSLELGTMEKIGKVFHQEFSHFLNGSK